MASIDQRTGTHLLFLTFFTVTVCSAFRRQVLGTVTLLSLLHQCLINSQALHFFLGRHPLQHGLHIRSTVGPSFYGAVLRVMDFSWSVVFFPSLFGISSAADCFSCFSGLLFYGAVSWVVGTTAHQFFLLLLTARPVTTPL